MLDSLSHTPLTLSSTLQISGVRYSDAGEYMCTVKYALCPDGVICSAATPVTGNIQLNLPGTIVFLYMLYYFCLYVFPYYNYFSLMVCCTHFFIY